MPTHKTEGIPIDTVSYLIDCIRKPEVLKFLAKPSEVRRNIM